MKLRLALFDPPPALGDPTYRLQVMSRLGAWWVHRGTTGRQWIVSGSVIFLVIVLSDFLRNVHGTRLWLTWLVVLLIEVYLAFLLRLVTRRLLARGAEAHEE